MSFTDIFIKRPVFATVLSLMLLLLGLIAYFKMPLREYPRIDATVVSIATSYPGANAELMETQVSNVLENVVAGVDGLDYITSSSTQGSSTVTAYFKLGTDINAAVTDVMNKVSSVRWQLPPGIQDPIVNKEDPNAEPVLYLSFSSKTMTAVQINDYLVRTVQPVLATLPGVGEAKIFGSLTYAMRLWFNPFAMTARAITLDDVMDAMQRNNLQAATGRIINSTQEFNTTVATDVSTEQQFNNLVIKTAEGKLLRLADIGYAQLATPEIRVRGIVNEQTANVMGVIPRSSANPLVVAEEIKKELARMQPNLPAGMTAKVVWDNSRFISSSIHEVKNTIVEAVIFVLLVIFLFLGSLRTIFIPVVTIPLSLIGVCALMYALDYSLNTMTFLAFVLAIGMVVDDAIVVSENVHRHIELGKSRFQAALIGAREIRFAVIAMTLTLAAVYLPIIFTSGLTGILFKEFAFTLAGAVIISGFVALTLSPMMCSKILAEKGKENKFEHWVNHITEGLARYYKKSLTLVLHLRFIVLLIVALLLVCCYFLYRSIPEELAPKEDMSGIMEFMIGPAAANLDYMEKYAREVDAINKTVPEGLDRLLIVGIPKGVNSAIGFLTLKDWSKRKRSVNQIIGSLFPKYMGVTGIMAFPLNPFSLPGSSGMQSINFVIKSTGSYKQLADVVAKIRQDASKNPSLSNMNVDLKIDKPQYDLTINRNLAGTLGVSMKSIGDTINMALGEPQFNRFVMNGRSYYVIPQIEARFRNKPEELNNLNVRTITGQLVPLSSFVTLHPIVAPQSLDHFQQMRSATFEASPAPGVTLGQALKALNEIAKKFITPDMQIDYSGESRQFIEAGGQMLVTFVFAIIFIFLILSAQFESWLDPLIVMFTVPLSTFGALLLLKLTGGTINIYTQIGLVTLVGLISKHGILMVEFANQLQQQGHELRDAIIEAATIRLRPILMTTAAMVLGALPLAMASGAGSESRNQIGIVIIGGMTLGTLFTLFVVPSVYTYLAKRKGPAELDVVTGNTP